MTYLSFREAIHDFAIFSIRDITKLFPDFDTRRLVEWREKGYIQKLTNKWYLFSDVPVDDYLHYQIANCLCRPSYISLESALSYYNLIPEGVFTIQSITTRKTMFYETGSGTFQYRNIKPQLFFGYHAMRRNEFPILIAELEKAILDYLYLTPRLQTPADLEGVRLNIRELKNSLDWKKLEKYACWFESAILNKRISWLKKISKHAIIV